MKTRLILAVLAVAAAPSLLAQGPGFGAKPNEATIQSGGEVAAATAAEVWLGMVDDARYGDSWQLASSLFKRTVPQDKWTELMKTRRQPLGKVVTRNVKSRQFNRTLQGAPEGQYVVLRYDASFENKKVALETVTTMLDTDGQWRVTGYFVH